MASLKRSANRLRFTREPLDIDDLMNASSFSGIRDVIESHFGKPDVPPDLPPAFETDLTRFQFLWKPEQIAVSVRLCADLIERLERESIEMFRAITNRGSEIGGILLGHLLSRNPLSLIVEDYEPVECAYSLGSSFTLSEGELSALRETLARRKDAGGAAVVGFFRSNARPTCALREEDLSMFDALFPEDHNIFVLAKPYTRKPCQGAIFVREQGRIRGEASYLEFPFSKAELQRTEALQHAIRIIPGEAPGASAGEPSPSEIPEAQPSPPVSGGEPEPAEPAGMESVPAPEAGVHPAAPVPQPVEPAAPEAKIEPRAPAPAPPEAEVEPRTGQPKPPRVAEAPAAQPSSTRVESAPSEPAPVAVRDFGGFAFGNAPEPSGSKRWVVGVVVAILLAGAGVLALTSRHDASSSKPVAAQPAPVPAEPASAAPSGQPSIELRVEGAEAGLTVRWDATQPEVSSASHGKIAFRDGGTPTTVELSADDLKKGSYTYAPKGDDVTIRLETGPQVFGSIRVLGATRLKKVAAPKNASGGPE